MTRLSLKALGIWETWELYMAFGVGTVGVRGMTEQEDKGHDDIYRFNKNFLFLFCNQSTKELSEIKITGFSLGPKYQASLFSFDFRFQIRKNPPSLTGT
jgi:hypothetical protein